MKSINVLAPKGFVIVDTIIGTLNLFQLANQFHRRKLGSKEDLFSIDIVGLSKDPIAYNNFFTLVPTKTIEEGRSPDLIIIPGIAGNQEKNIRENKALVNWIRDQRIEKNAEIASLCRGAFLLAETGLLHGKSCATHWLTHDKFQQMYPEVKLIPEKVISEDNGIYSSGGAYSFLNLVIYLIEKYYGRETAIWCSKVSEIEFDRLDQNQFVVFNGQKDHEDAEILEVQNYLENHYSEKISVDQLAEKTSTSTRNFIRRFKKATNNTPIEYIQRLRIEAAKKKLESSTSQISEVMFDSGYTDNKAFRTIFKRYAGLTPLEYRNKYNREMAFA